MEKAFFALTVNLGCAVNTLGYPQAALLCLCLAMCCDNSLAAVTAAVRQEQGAQAEQELSGYAVADEVRGTYRGLDSATQEEDWQPFRQASPPALAELLAELARRVDVRYDRKNRVRPKKPSPPRPHQGNKHVATHRLLHPDLYPPKQQQNKKDKKKQSSRGTARATARKHNRPIK